MTDLERVKDICDVYICVTVDNKKCPLFDIEIAECMLTSESPRDWDIPKIKKILDVSTETEVNLNGGEG